MRSTRHGSPHIQFENQVIESQVEPQVEIMHLQSLVLIISITEIK